MYCRAVELLKTSRLPVRNLILPNQQVIDGDRKNGRLSLLAEASAAARELGLHCRLNAACLALEARTTEHGNW